MGITNNIMAVVGLDFGNLSVLIGQAGRGGVDVILNDSSNRQTASYVSIQGKQRFLGDSGSAMVSNPNNDSIFNPQLRNRFRVENFPFLKRNYSEILFQRV